MKKAAFLLFAVMMTKGQDRPPVVFPSEPPMVYYSGRLPCLDGLFLAVQCMEESAARAVEQQYNLTIIGVVYGCMQTQEDIAEDKRRIRQSFETVQAYRRAGRLGKEETFDQIIETEYHRQVDLLDHLRRQDFYQRKQQAVPFPIQAELTRLNDADWYEVTFYYDRYENNRQTTIRCLRVVAQAGTGKIRSIRTREKEYEPRWPCLADPASMTTPE